MSRTLSPGMTSIPELSPYASVVAENPSADPPVVGGGGGQAFDVGPRLRRELGLRFLEMPGRHLHDEVVGRHQAEPARQRIERAEVEVRTLFIGLAAVEDRQLPFPSPVVDTGGDHPEGDVRGVEPVVRDGRNRVGDRRGAMWKRDGPERRLAGEAGIDLPAQRPAQRAIVIGGQLHEEVVRMLAVVNRVALAHLAAGQEIQETAIAHRPRFRAPHRPQPDAPAGEWSPRHQHAPVHAADLMGAGAAGPMPIARFGDQLPEDAAVQHHAPAAPLPHGAEHRRQHRRPGRARRVAGREQRRQIGRAVLFVMRVRSGCRNGLPGNWNRGCGKNGKNENGLTNHECWRWALIYIFSPPIFLRPEENDADHL